MRIENARPEFGGRLKSPEYYEQVNSVIRVLREHSTLRVISNHLNAQLFKTPSGKEWNRERLSAYLKSNDIYKGN
ncbi:recombinase family protein [Massilia niastensis]|uniref:recombinase family protein n=1 Tax=Massilia niastensis TaxID=544911 RepID=UPI0012EB4E69|nr:recombinase family protein [Massilia niastensis]